VAADTSTIERCAWPHCRSTTIELVYMRRPLCEKHWQKLAAMLDNGRRDEALAALGIQRSPHPEDEK